ncbi:MAG: hypothetical protein AAGA31_06760, partial [Bacteroidota bacterium]
MLYEAFINYALTKILDKSGEILVKTVEDYEETLSTLIDNGDLNKSSSSLIGFGSCGAQICEYVQKKISVNDLDEEKDKDALNRISKFIRGDKEERIFIDPLIFTIDLDRNTYYKLNKNKGEFDKFNPIDIDWEGGAGHIQIVGEYHAYKFLSVPPETISSKNWELFFTFLINSVGLKINPTRLFFYIFSIK